MTDVARELDARLRQLDAETARHLESLVRDALALTTPTVTEQPVAARRRWPVVPTTGHPITQEEIDNASDDSE